MVDIKEISREEALDKALYHLERLQTFLWLSGAPHHPRFDEGRKVIDLEAVNAELLEACIEMMGVLQQIDFSSLPIEYDACFWADWDKAIQRATDETLHLTK